MLKRLGWATLVAVALPASTQSTDDEAKLKCLL